MYHGEFICKAKGIVLTSKTIDGQIIGQGFIKVTHLLKNNFGYNEMFETWENVNDHADAFWHYKAILPVGEFAGNSFKTLKPQQLVVFDLHLKDSGKYNAQKIEVIGNLQNKDSINGNR